MPENPFKIFLIDALQDPEIVRVLKDLFVEAQREINAPKIPEPEDITGIQGAMEILGYSKQTIYDRIFKSKTDPRFAIPHFKRGNRLYFSKQALRDWIKDQDG